MPLLWIPAVLYMAAIFVLSSISDLGPSPAGVSDKSWHMLAYAGLGVLLLLPLVEAKLSGVTWRRALAAIALATLYGVSDEVHQSFVPGRSPEALDVAADAIGAILGVASVGLLAAARAWGILRSWSHAPEGGHSRRTFNGDTPP
jgi:VanZ family protein